jgi:hypothetical protein
MTNRKLIVTGLLFSCIVFVFAQSKQEKEVLEVSRAKFNWLVNKNIDSLQFVLDDRLTYIHSNGWVQSKKELIDDLLSEKLTYDKIEVLESTVRLYSKSAVVTGKGKFVASLSGTTNTFDLTYTETYVLQKREWKLVSRHASRTQ